MDRSAAMEWQARFLALPQCVRLTSYATGYNPFASGDRPGAVINALNGMVLLVFCAEAAQEKGLLSKERPEQWRLGLVTPVMGYPNTHASSSEKATTLLTEVEAGKLLSIWAWQGRELAPAPEVESETAALGWRVDAPGPVAERTVVYATDMAARLHELTADRMQRLFYEVEIHWGIANPGELDGSALFEETLQQLTVKLDEAVKDADEVLSAREIALPGMKSPALHDFRVQVMTPLMQRYLDILARFDALSVRNTQLSFSGVISRVDALSWDVEMRNAITREIQNLETLAAERRPAIQQSLRDRETDDES